MKRHSIVVRLNPSDTKNVDVSCKGSMISELRFMDDAHRIDHGISQMLDQLKQRGLCPNETALDLAILAASVTAADTKISRKEDAQDSWTREIDLYMPVVLPDLWQSTKPLIERMLKFLTGDIWSITFRPRQEVLHELINQDAELMDVEFDAVCLFSGGLDSFVGAIDLLAKDKSPLFVSHYRDVSTKNQLDCAKKIGTVYGDLTSRHVRANVSFNKTDLPGLDSETTTRGRSFIFFALACLAADALDGETPIYIPENGLISLNVPLDPLRIGAWSTRTTHPFYMKRWKELVENLGIEACLVNPYQFMTKGEMLNSCQNRELLQDSLDLTISCSSVAKQRWQKRPPGHCGYCAPCLIRRASVKAAFGNDRTDYSIPDLTKRPLNAHQAEAVDIRAFQMMGRRLARDPQLAETLVYKSGPLNDYDMNDINQYADVFRRGIAEVGNIVDNVKITTA